MRNICAGCGIADMRDWLESLDEREEWEERAAIMEFDGHMTRAQAENEAWKLILVSRSKKCNNGYVHASARSSK